MSTCIFCLVKSVDLTPEHVFPAAIGGKIVLNKGTCARCNHGFSKFEKPLLTELAPFRALFRIQNRRGDVPEVEATVKTGTKDFAGRLKSDGSVQLKRTVTEIDNNDGTREFEHRFLTLRQRTKLMKEVKEKGLRYRELDQGAPVRAEVHIGGSLDEIGSLNALRTAAKIAYVGFAYFARVGLAVTDSFTMVRTFIMSGTGKACARQFVSHKFVEEVQQGPHQHSIILGGRHDRTRVDAIVRLFGGLSYFVTLSDCYAGADFCKTLVYDGYRGAEDGVLFSHIDGEILQIESVLVNPMTIWDDATASAHFFCQYLERAFRGIPMPELKIR